MLNSDRVSLSEPLSISSDTPIALSTCDGSSFPLEHADPEDAHTPRISSPSTRDSPSTPENETLTLPHSRGEIPPLSLLPEISSSPAMSLSRSTEILSDRPLMSPHAYSIAAPIETIAAVFSVPERSPFSCPPPQISG